ncbi:hypothetical protein PENSPDRAFT_735573 [Peniophora sp. CONT]|nr:hypothetical protein PENSPDRAFT_735573 [Peniophora sp. CONT]
MKLIATLTLLATAVLATALPGTDMKRGADCDGTGTGPTSSGHQRMYPVLSGNASQRRALETQYAYELEESRRICGRYQHDPLRKSMYALRHIVINLKIERLSGTSWTLNSSPKQRNCIHRSGLVYVCTIMHINAHLYYWG